MGRLALIAAVVLLAATACGVATSSRSTAPHGWGGLSSADLQKLVVYTNTAPPLASGDEAGMIWRVRVDGTRRTRLASGNDAAISPNGRWIVFRRRSRLFVMPAAGGAVKQVYTAPRRYPRLVDTTWAPDSRHVGFIATRNGASTWYLGNSLVVVDVLSVHVRRVTAPSYVRPVSSFAFSPNSRLIAYQQAVCCNSIDDPLSVSPVREGSPSRLASFAEGFDFSPDSRKVVYASSGSYNGNGADLYTVGVRGGTPVRLTEDRKSSDPIWGKSGIAFYRLRKVEHRYLQRGDIWLSDATPQHVRRLTHLDEWLQPYQFSADGTELLVSNQRQLWAVDVTTGVERRLSKVGGFANQQGFSADGNVVLQASECDKRHDLQLLEALPFAGGRPRVIARGPCETFGWDPAGRLQR